MTLLASIPNCTDLYSIATHGLNTPVVNTQQSASVAPDPGGLRLTIPITVQNPNDIPIALDSVDYTVSVTSGGSTAPGFSGSQDAVTVDEHSSETVELSGVIPPSTLLGLRPGTTTYTISGTVHADSPAGIAIDVTFTGGGSFSTP
ncbi:MAG TPA: LEA type 2 family protein [Myxococcales bacterium]